MVLTTDGASVFLEGLSNRLLGSTTLSYSASRWGLKMGIPSWGMCLCQETTLGCFISEEKNQSTSLAMKIKTLLRVHLFPVRMAIMKKIGKDGGRRNLYTMLVGMQINVVTMKIGILFLKNINNSTSIWSSYTTTCYTLQKI